MYVRTKIQSFLKMQLEKNNLKRVDVAKNTGIASYTIHHLYNGSQDNVTFKTVLRLADYFECTIDEVLGREKFQIAENPEFKSVDAQTSMGKIKDFINVKMNESGLDATKFARSCGLGKGSLRGFIKENEKHQALNCKNIVAVADTFDVSIDELIGRKLVSPNQIKALKIPHISLSNPEEKTEIKDSILQNLSSQDAANAQHYQKTLQSFQSPVTHKVKDNNSPYPKVKTPSYFR